MELEDDDLDQENIYPEIYINGWDYEPVFHRDANIDIGIYYAFFSGRNNDASFWKKRMANQIINIVIILYQMGLKPCALVYINIIDSLGGGEHIPRWFKSKIVVGIFKTIERLDENRRLKARCMKSATFRRALKQHINRIWLPWVSEKTYRKATEADFGIYRKTLQNHLTPR